MPMDREQETYARARKAGGAFDLSSIMRAAHAEVQGQLAGLGRGAAAGYSLAKFDLASFDYRKRFARALSKAWAKAASAGGPSCLWLRECGAWLREKLRASVLILTTGRSPAASEDV